MVAAHPCDDCGQDEDFSRRTRCKQCGLLLCWFCRERFHQPAVKEGRPCRTQKPATISATEDRYGATGR